MADDGGQVIIPFHFEDDVIPACGDCYASRVEEICAAQACTDVIVNGHTDIARAVYKGNALIIDDGFGAQALAFHLGVQLDNQAASVRSHPENIAVDNALGFLCCQAAGYLVAHAVPLDLLFQVDDRGVAIIITDAELHALIDAVELFTQGLVRQVVEIQARMV